MDVVTAFFLKILSMGIMTSFVIVFILLIRGSVMRNFPKKYTYVLWLIVGVRLICPFSISSSVSVFNLWQFIQKVPFVQDILSGVSAEMKEDDLLAGSYQPVSVGNYNLSDAAGQQLAGEKDEMPGAAGQQLAGEKDEMPGAAGQQPSGEKDGMPDKYNQPPAGNTGKWQDGRSLSGHGSKLSDKDSQAVPDNNKAEKDIDIQPVNKKQADNNQGMAVEEAFNKFIPDRVLSALGLLWIAGMILLLLWNLFLYTRMRRKTCKAVLYHDNIFECEGISSPFVMGLICPRIYIPFRLEQQEREYILKHEQYHIRRHDYIINFISFLITLVYWFHPLIWVAYFCMVRDMEMRCDEYVIAAMGTDIRKDYSRLLLAFAANKRQHSMNLPAFGETDTRRRVKNIMNYKKRGKVVGIVSCILLSLTGITCITNAGAVRNDDNISAKSNIENKDKNVSSKTASQGNQENSGNGISKRNTNGNETIIANGQINGWQVQLVLKKGDKKRVILGKSSPKSSYTDVYEGVFYLSSYKDGRVQDKCVLTFFDGEKKLIFPEEIKLNLADYDGDKNADDFSLGQMNAASAMEYQFYTVDGDGSIVQYDLVSDKDTTESIATKNGILLKDGGYDYSKKFYADSEGIQYMAMYKGKEYETTVSAERLVFLTGDLGESDENAVQKALHRAVNATMPQDVVIEAETGVWHEVKYGADETGYLLANSDTYDDMAMTMRLDFIFYQDVLIRYVSKDYEFVEGMEEKRISAKKAVLLVQKFAEEFLGEKIETAKIETAGLPYGYDSRDFAAFTDVKGNSYVVQLNRNMVVEFDIGKTGTGVVSDKQQEIKNREKAEDENRNKLSNRVKLLYYEPDSLSGIHEDYIPEYAEQEKLQKMAAKLDAFHVCSEKERNQFYGEEEMGYDIEYGGNVWGVFSGGYVCLLYGKDYNIDNDHEIIIYYPSLCSLSERVLKEAVDYTSVKPKEIKDITSATLVYSKEEFDRTKWEVTDRKALRKLEKLLSSGKHIRGSGCPMGKAILTLRRTGKKDICVTVATDSCAVFRLNGVCYDYGSIENADKLRKIFNVGRNW